MVQTRLLSIGKFDVVLHDIAGPNPTLEIKHDALEPDAPLWRSIAHNPWLRASLGRFEAPEFQGNFQLRDEPGDWSEHQTVKDVQLKHSDEEAIVMKGTLSGSHASFEYEATLRLAQHSERQLCMDVRVYEANGDGSASAVSPVPTHVMLQYEAGGQDEKVFGMGTQFTHLNLKGSVVPVWVSEQGVGRGLEPLTSYLNGLHHGEGGGPLTTYAPLPAYITSSGRSLFLTNTEYSLFDLREANITRIYVASGQRTPVLSACIIAASSVPEALTELTAYQGRMHPLPSWALQGAIVGMQGGTQQVRERLALLENAGVPVAGLWLQDWPGKRDDAFGQRVLWNWEVDLHWYHNWGDMLSELRARSIRVLSYINPYLAVNASAFRPLGLRRNLFEEAKAAGYLVRAAGGVEPYLQASGSQTFVFATVDLTNPDAVSWYEEIIRCNMLCVCNPRLEDEDVDALGCGEGGAGAGVSGYMADFAEYLPEDVVLHDGTPGHAAHNAFPRLWAELNRRAVESAGKWNDTVFFMRSGFLRSPAYSRLFWMGDQLTTWDKWDGMRSALIGMLSSGLSGWALGHSDVGGYTAMLDLLIDGETYTYARVKELLLRWMEMSAFSDAIYRSHEGNRPVENVQVYSDNDTLRHFATLSRVFASLAPYKQQLMAEAAQLGWPLVRPLFFHYPHLQQAWDIDDEFMLGNDLLVAPVLEPGVLARDIYLPNGTWVGYWDCDEVRAGLSGFLLRGRSAPLGRPPVFIRKGAGSLLSPKGCSCYRLPDERGTTAALRAPSAERSTLEMEATGTNLLPWSTTHSYLGQVVVAVTAFLLFTYLRKRFQSREVAR